MFAEKRPDPDVLIPVKPVSKGDATGIADAVKAEDGNEEDAANGDNDPGGKDPFEAVAVKGLIISGHAPKALDETEPADTSGVTQEAEDVNEEEAANGDNDPGGKDPFEAVAVKGLIISGHTPKAPDETEPADTSGVPQEAERGLNVPKGE